ncbi:uncharacterized protein LOC106650778 isoform X2 [Trichogramma pretiosum]|uniref:uncharacterized protein LOC106650778 isoform X2 n=1 Tax=Trichogramma pretiosum TaxID=7493 RepID=UPI000C71BF00|nr:uncharacterized protein LOC106650778 isoform X2 [Trichogramma pretiosum]
MPMKTPGGAELEVVVGDVLALRGTGLAAAETWALLCQAAQALQDLFLSNGGVVGDSRAEPLVTPHTLELTAQGRVKLLQAAPDTARAYLPPEYRPGRIYSDTDSEKMWMYSLGRALLDTTPRATALTGTVSVSPSSALQSVLAAMTEPDPQRRASLMNLLDVISEYCRTRLQSRPFTHTVTDMYREVVRSASYSARKRAAVARATRQQHQLQQQQQQAQPHPLSANAVPARQNPPGRHHHHHHHHGAKANGNALFKAQSRNSRSQPNLLNLGPEGRCSAYGYVIDARNLHLRTNSQPEYCQLNRASIGATVPHHVRSTSNIAAMTASSASSVSGSVASNNRGPNVSGGGDVRNANNACSSSGYGFDPVYAMPVKPFLSTQDVRNANTNNNNGNAARLFQRAEQQQQQFGITTAEQQQHQQHQLQRPQTIGNATRSGISQLNINESTSAAAATAAAQTRETEDLYATPSKPNSNLLQRQHSSPQFPLISRQDREGKKVWEFDKPTSNELAGKSASLSASQNGNNSRTTAASQRQYQQTQPTSVAADEEQSPERQKQIESKASSPYSTPRGPPPPKPPRIITSLKKAQAAHASAAASAATAAATAAVNAIGAQDVAVAKQQKPPRDFKNGPRALKSKAVQRAPSRLYRTVNGPAASFNKTHCVGPEFVVRANQPAKLLTVGDFKINNMGRLTVILLTGQRIEVTCDPQKVTAGELFQVLVQSEGLEENFTLGLAALLAGDFAMLPSETKLNKVAPPGWASSGKNKISLGLPTTFMLYLRLRFFLPSLRGIRSWISKHMLYLQIRRCILEQQFVCPLAQLINLAGLALQAEFGDYSVNEHGCSDYFLLEHYVPESLILNSEEQKYRHPQLPDSGEALRKRLQQAHFERRGLDPSKAEEMFISHAQCLPDYGAHYYTATVDAKEFNKIIAKQKKCAETNSQQKSDDQPLQQIAENENIYELDKNSDYQIYGKIEFSNTGAREQYFQRSSYTDEQKIMLSRSPSSVMDDIYAAKKANESENDKSSNNNKNKAKTAKPKKGDSDVWLAVHSQGLKVFERGARLRERVEMSRFDWKDIQTLSYGKNYLIVHTKIGGKRFKFKLKMDHRKSFYAFKLTSLHHQFFLKLRSELTSLQGLVKDFGVPLIVEPNSPKPKMRPESAKTKITFADAEKQHKLEKPRLEEQQNKENENPFKESDDIKLSNGNHIDTFDDAESNINGNGGQVNKRLEPEGEARDTEDENDHTLTVNRNILSTNVSNGLKVLEHHEIDRIYNYIEDRMTNGQEKEDFIYSMPKKSSFSQSKTQKSDEKIENPEALYAAINKSGLPKKIEYTVPENEAWKVVEVQRLPHMSSNGNYNYNQSRNRNLSKMPQRLEVVKVENRSMYSTSMDKRRLNLNDDLELRSLQSDSASAKSTESPLPEAYVLNADIRATDEPFCIPDETMSNSLLARLDELSFAEERVLRTIKLQRGHGGSIGLQVTEGNDSGVYVQAVSVGGSADMAGNVNKGDRIVAINGQSLLNLRYEDALKMLQSTSETVELVLSQVVSLPCPALLTDSPDDDLSEPMKNSYLQNLKFGVSSERESSSMTSTKWLQKLGDVASVQNTSSAYSSAASSAMGNHNVNSLYVPDIDDTEGIHSVSRLLTLEDLDISHVNNQQVFI